MTRLRSPSCAAARRRQRADDRRQSTEFGLGDSTWDELSRAEVGIIGFQKTEPGYLVSAESLVKKAADQIKKET